ncbi:hypothetical protein [Halarsenatibacter silvermanii]|uniref:DRTGG domain-containing protein n=1 Tax=Halarsenatibacter silvermanii TaxID=321763 RepID=A0A1G9QLV1_9FIRM|nr:hypothetical protein [Halarsenatibacter silvermanii]SDM12012.1 hypothetical protein SAMN04488692_11731 [Halarsenatibacter silvermanii]
MTIQDIEELLDLKTIVEGDSSLEVKTACGADLMSDVLAFSTRKTVLLTGLTNPQVVRTAEMVDIRVIIFVRDKNPEKKTVELARQKNIALYRASDSLFACCGILYQAGVQPEKIKSFY